MTGGSNSWKLKTVTNYAFLPSEEFPILVYFRETQTPVASRAATGRVDAAATTGRVDGRRRRREPGGDGSRRRRGYDGSRRRRDGPGTKMTQVANRVEAPIVVDNLDGQAHFFPAIARSDQIAAGFAQAGCPRQ